MLYQILPGKENIVSRTFFRLVNSILKIDSTIVKDIYIDIDNINSGFIYLKKQIIGDIFTRSSETRRYVESLKILSNHLMGEPENYNF